VLITSGLGGKFPPGYPVGTVRSIRSVPGLPFLEVDAEPAAALNRIREVLLIMPPKPAKISAYENAFPAEGDTAENTGTALPLDAASTATPVAPAEASPTGTATTAAPGNAASADTTAEPAATSTASTAGAELPAGETLENTSEQPPAASSNAPMPVEDPE
jgi:rod shape-determining protein MreC